MPLAASNVCPKCGFANQPGYQFCTNCGSAIAAAATMAAPPAPAYAPGAVPPPPAYMPPPGYGYAGMWEAERSRQIDRTKTGVLLLLIGTLISWITFASIGLIGGLLSLIGAIMVILGRKAFGPKHSRNVIISLVLFLVGIVGVIVLAIVLFATIGSFVTPAPAVILSALNTFLIGTVIVSAISGLASVFFTYELQSQIGKILLWAGYGSSVGVELVAVLVVMPLINDALSGGTVNSAALEALLVTIDSYAYLAVISAVLFAAANYIAWDRINKRLIPGPIAPPSMPAPPMAPPPT